MLRTPSATTAVVELIDEVMTDSKRPPSTTYRGIKRSDVAQHGPRLARVGRHIPHSRKGDALVIVLCPKAATIGNTSTETKGQGEKREKYVDEIGNRGIANDDQLQSRANQGCGVATRI